MRKRLKRGKGTGSIYNLGKGRRKPWRVMVTTGWTFDETTNRHIQHRTTLGYFEKKSDAVTALEDYLRDPYDIKSSTITFSEVYDKWSSKHFPTLANPSSIRTITSAYNYCKPLYNMRMRDIKVHHLESTIQDAEVGSSTKGKIKSLFNSMYRYALKHEIVDKNYAELCDPIKQSTPTKKKTPFSQKEIDFLWDNVHKVPFVDMILIGIYSGWRPRELATLKTKDIDLKQKIMRGGSKTDAGKNRIVPIHPLIYSLIEKRLDSSKEYLFNDMTLPAEHTELDYDKYYKRFINAMNHLHLNHAPHETRHTFVTKAKQVKMDENILKKIIGHSITDITESIYTHRDIEELYTEIIKIKK